MWTNKELQTQDPSESSPEEPVPPSRFAPDEKIEIVRKTANSKEECQQLKAELEGQGFTVMVREPTGLESEGAYYVATLLAEKRESVRIDTWAVERERLAQKNRDRKIDVMARAGFWVVVALVLIGLLYLLGPLIRACRSL